MTQLLNDFLSGSAAWGVLLTLAAFALGTLINKVTGKAIFNPLLLGSIFVIIFLSVCNIPYADYYYGELGNSTDTTDGEISYDADLAGDAGMRAEGNYDAVTSATEKKWNSMFADTTYVSEPNENGGGKILGVSGVEVAIEQSLYDQLTADAKDGKTSGVLGSLFSTFTPNKDQETVPAAYKQLFADGTLSATITAEPEVDLTNVTPTLKTDSKYGDYQLNMNGLNLGEGNLVTA